MPDLFDLAFDRCRHELFQGSLSVNLKEYDDDDFYTQTFDENDLLEANNSPKSKPINGYRPSYLYSSSLSEKVVKHLERHDELFHDYDEITTKPLHENLRKETRNRLQQLRVSRERYSKYTSNAIDSFEMAKRRVEDRRNHVEENCRLHYQAVLRRLKSQNEGADRRLRELLYEIIGEYGKSEIRVTRRHAYLKYASRVNMMWSLWTLRWKRFITRLCLEITPHEIPERSAYRCKGTLLCPRAHLNEIRVVGDMLQKALGENSFKVSAVVRFERKSRSIEKLLDNGFRVASTYEEYKEIIAALRSWLSPSTAASRPSFSREANRAMFSPTSTSTTTTPMKSPTSKQKISKSDSDESIGLTFISCEPIEWVHPASFHPKFWDKVVGPTESSAALSPVNTDIHTIELDEFMTRFMLQYTSTIACDRVYYCMQERNLALKGPSSFPTDKNSSSLDLLEKLESIYVYNKDVDNISQALCNLRTDIEQPQIVQQPCSTHRICYSESLVGKHKEAINGYPDIIQAESSSGNLYHYAPALLTNLVETGTFGECGFTSDQIRDMSSAPCSHPHLAYLASSHFAPIETLYVMVRMSVGASNNPPTDSGSFYMMPLTSACIQELIKAHLLSPLNQVGMEHAEVPVKNGKPLKGCSSVDLLPDHSRKSDIGEVKQFYHRYAIIHSSGEYTPVQNNGDDQNSNDAEQQDKRKEKKHDNLTTSSNDDSSSRTIAGAYYLVQMSIAKDKEGQKSPSSPRSRLSSPRASPRKYEIANNSESNQIIVEDESHKRDERHMNILLIAYSRGMGDTLTLPVSSSDTVKRQQQWQNALLSGICRWRACLCESVDSKKVLCRYHLDLKKFLDKRQKLLSKSSVSGASLESNKYMPRRPPELSGNELEQVRRSVSLQVQFDMSMIRAASTLLIELWDGNLKNTLRSYIQRVCDDLSLRKRLESITMFATAKTKKLQQSQSKKDVKNGDNDSNSNNTIMKIMSPVGVYPVITLRSLPPQRRPAWHQWCDKNELNASFDRMFAAQNHVDAILRYEKAISVEIQELVRLGIFPSFEITMIRKDMKKFKELEEMKENGELNREGSEDEGNKINIETAEVGLCERKLSLLRARKEDELELRAKTERKAKKLALQQQNATPEKEYQMRF